MAAFWLNMQYFYILPGSDNDQSTVPRAVRRSPASRGVADRAAAHGPRGQHSGGHGGGHVADGASCPQRDEDAGISCWLGGVALNCVANGRVLREGPFDNLWIQPAAGDAGGALGAALFVWYQLLGQPRDPQPHDRQRGSLLGPHFSPTSVETMLMDRGYPYHRCEDESELVNHVVDQLEQGKIVGWFQNRMEFGPRALGARSILGDPRSPDMQTTMNLKIKFRESFRPFAPAVLEGHAQDWFTLGPGHESPYMLLVAPVESARRTPLTETERRTMARDPDLRRRVNMMRSTVPAVTHVDYSARVQTVDRARNPRFHHLIATFHRKTGCPMLVNTSFNVRGEPIVCTPEDAYRCFLATEMDVLVLEDCIVDKRDVAHRMDAAAQREHLAQFQLD